MGCATMDFTDLGDVTGASFPQGSKLEDQQLYHDSEISSEYCFEGIVGKSAALRVLEQSRSWRPRFDCLAPRGNWNRQGVDCRRHS
jgi:hypothetical protein